MQTYSLIGQRMKFHFKFLNTIKIDSPKPSQKGGSQVTLEKLLAMIFLRERTWAICCCQAQLRNKKTICPVTAILRFDTYITPLILKYPKQVNPPSLVICIIPHTPTELCAEWKSSCFWALSHLLALSCPIEGPTACVSNVQPTGWIWATEPSH